MEPKLLDQLRGRLRVKHYSIRTEQAYVDWVRRFILFHGKRHPKDLGPAEVEAFLTDLAVRGRVSASTQNQAKSAILFLFREVINSELPWLDGIVGARKTQRLPVVLSVDEVDTVLGRMRGTSGLVARLLYGSGLRILECLRLRVKDVDFDRHEILVRDGKGAKDRVTMLPESVVGTAQAASGASARVCMPRTWPPGSDRCTCPTRLIASTPMPARSGCGSTSSPRPGFPRIRAQARPGGITPTRSRSSARCSPLCVRQGFTSRRPHIRCAIYRHTATPFEERFISKELRAVWDLSRAVGGPA